MHWLGDQITYQIFPDRFAIGKPHTSDSKLALPPKTAGIFVPDDTRLRAYKFFKARNLQTEL